MQLGSPEELGEDSATQLGLGKLRGGDMIPGVEKNMETNSLSSDYSLLACSGIVGSKLILLNKLLQIMQHYCFSWLFEYV